MSRTPEFLKEATTFVRRCVGGCWFLMIVALVISGAGLYDVSRAAVTCAKAIAAYNAQGPVAVDAPHGPISVPTAGTEVTQLSLRGFAEVYAAGVLLVAALRLLTLAGVQVHLRSASRTSE